VNRRFLAVLATTLFTACDQATSPVSPISPSDEITAAVGPGGFEYSGRATTEVSVLLLNKKLCDTGPLPSSGGTLSDHGPNVTIPGLLSAQLFSCFTKGENGAATTEADVFHLSLKLPGYSIFADVLTSMARAACNGEIPYTNGHSHIVRLIVNGQQKTITGAVNQKISLGLGAYLVINEQSKTIGGGSASITVTALHVVVHGVANIAFSKSHADINCPGSA
jgi:hypothetical protein